MGKTIFELLTKEELNKIPIGEISFVAFDLETTGLFPPTNRVVEIGGVKFKRDRIEAYFNQLINPRCSIPKDAYYIHHISDEMVADMPRIEDVLPSFLSFIKDSVLIAHVATFDADFISCELARSNIVPPSNIILDTRNLTRFLFPYIPNYKLETISQYFGFEADGLHRALTDSTICFKIFRECIKRLKSGWNTPFYEIVKINGQLYKFNSYQFQRGEDGFLFIERVTKAIEKNEKIKIIYVNNFGEISERLIFPHAIIYYKENIYLNAFCYLRNEERSFRADRILKLF